MKLDLVEHVEALESVRIMRLGTKQQFSSCENIIHQWWIKSIEMLSGLKEGILQRHLKRKEEWASEIIENSLWLGSGAAASDEIALSSRGIKFIVNVADDVPNYHEQGFHYLNLGVGDFGQDVGISRVFDEAFTFLQMVQDSSDRVLVHCAAGANRSATLVVAWLMYSQRMSLRVAFELVKTKRPGISLLRDNRQQLWEYESELFQTHSYASFDESCIGLML